MNNNYDPSASSSSPSNFPGQSPVQVTKNNKTGLIIATLTVLVILLSLSTVTFALLYLSDRTPDMQTVNPENLTPTPTPTTMPVLDITPSTPGQIFNYQNFSIEYPNDWRLTDMNDPALTPLTSRFKNFEKVAVLTKNDLYMIISIETEGGYSGGVFLTDADFDNFIAEKSMVIIDNSTFYLGNNHTSISSLTQSHSGPYAWANLGEYLPDKLIPQTGETIKGYESVIKRGNYAYTFIVTGATEGETDPELQVELINILETIKW